jgi:ABC-type bacteriocin/lantibiotic exporter with double-glycine peptidase domain
MIGVSSGPVGLRLWWRYCFFDKNSAGTLLGLLLFQASYSFAPVFLGKAILGGSTDKVAGFVALYLFFNFLPYGITAISYILRARWLAHVRAKSSEYVAQRIQGNLNLVQSRSEYERCVALTTSNCQSAVTEAVNFVYDSTSALASAGFTLIFLAWFVEPLLLAAYSVSLVLCSLVIYHSRKRQARLARLQERALNGALSVLSGALPALVLRQPPFFSDVRARLRRRWSRYFGRANASAMSFQAVSTLQALIIWLPICVGIVFLLIRQPLAASAALIGFLPRIVELLLDISNLVMRLINYGVQTARLAWLDEQLTMANYDEPRRKGKIDPESLRVQLPARAAHTLLELNGVDGLMSAIRDKKGRVLISGPNGCGKTTLLLALKAKLGSRAILILANFRQGAHAKSVSVGQAVLSEIEAAIAMARSQPQGFALILDEWNANLDTNNRELVDRKLDILAAELLIIETKHR